MDIEIMYADLSRRRVPIGQAAALPREGVLFIVLSTEWGNRNALVRRVWGNDWYGLQVTKKHVWLAGWDDDDEYWHVKRLSDPCGPFVQKKRPYFLPRNAIVFEGGYVDPSVWNKALEIFDAEMF